MEQKPTWTNTQQAIAYALVASFIGVIFMWMLFPPKAIDQSVMTVVNMLLGALVAKFTTIVDFFFGSSQGSKDKDDANNKMMATLTGTGPSTSPTSPGVVAAAKTAAAEVAAVAAPPAAEIAAGPAAEKAVAEAMHKDAIDEKPEK